VCGGNLGLHPCAASALLQTYTPSLRSFSDSLSRRTAKTMHKVLSFLKLF
jgi:hypothetical protein